MRYRVRRHYGATGKRFCLILVLGFPLESQAGGRVQRFKLHVVV